MMRHMTERPRTLYRSRDGMIMGVFKGMATFFDVQVLWIRVLAVALLVFTGFWPMTILYLVTGFILKPEPVLPLEDEAECEFYASYMGSRKMAVSRLLRQFEQMDRRLRRMEDIVTSRDFDWERRMSS